MATFNSTAAVNAALEQIPAVLEIALQPAKVVTLPGLDRALVRMGSYLHIFQWTSSVRAGTTLVQYSIHADVRGDLGRLIDDPYLSKAQRADISEAERVEAEARLTRITEAAQTYTLTHPVDPDAGIAARPSAGRAPFGMGMLSIVTILTGLGGVYLAAENWRRMGRQRLFWLTLILGTLLIFPILYLLSSLLNGLPPSAGVARYFFPFVLSGLLVAWQRPAYDRWKMMYGQGASNERAVRVLIPLLMSIVGLVVLVAGLLVGGGLFNSLTNTLTAQNISVSGVTLRYPGSWSVDSAAQQKAVGCNTTALTECVMALDREGNTGHLLVIRVSQLGMPDEVEAAEKLFILGMTRAVKDLQTGTVSLMQLDHHPTADQTLINPTNATTIRTLFVRETPSHSLFFMAIAAVGTDAAVTDEITQMVNSIHIDAQNPESTATESTTA